MNEAYLNQTMFHTLILIGLINFILDLIMVSKPNICWTTCYLVSACDISDWLFITHILLYFKCDFLD